MNQQYDEMAEQHRAAYAAFRKIYVDQHPPPEQTALRRDWESLFMAIAMIVIVAASVVVSGSRTIIEFGGGVVGLAGFVMLEGGIILFSYFRTRLNFSKERLGHVRQRAAFGLSLAFVVAVGANIHAVLKAADMPIVQWIDALILIALAISAPTLAFITGDIAAVEVMRNAQRARDANEAHDGKLREWSEQLNAHWEAQRRNYGIKVKLDVRPNAPVLSAPVSSGHLLDMDMDGQTDISGHATGRGYTKKHDAQQLVRDHFTQHPEDLRLPIRELAEKIRVGKSTIAVVRKEYQ